MYIIAKNKDYYDGVVGSVGIDKTLVYERTTVETIKPNEMPNEFHPKKSWGWRGHDRHNHFLNIGYADIKNRYDLRKADHKYESCRSFIVGFCGKLYLGWYLYYKVKVRDVMGLMIDEERYDIVYGYENVKEYLESGYWRGEIDDDVSYVMKYNPIDIFREIKAPIFVHITGRNNKFITNPMLKDFEFYKVVDAFTAFTELQMFIGGVLGVGEKEIVEVEDKYKISQHGFDKWSFRKEPSKNKKHG